MIQPAINLASQPFRRDRPIVVASFLLGGMLVILLITLISLAVSERSQVADTRRSIDALERQLKTLAAEQNRVDAVMRRSENAEVLERSLFLNTLLTRKGISWTRIFADLEKILPHNVRIMAIQPQVFDRQQLYLTMMVGAESTEPVEQFLWNLEGSDAFGATYVHSSLPPSQTEPLYRYRMSVSYAQKF
jgi:Tfp pilus assembly protein PilN